jgi:hypothetical protein
MEFCIKVNGLKAPELTKIVEERIAEHIEKKSYTVIDIENIFNRRLDILEKTGDLEDTHLELLRRLAATWNFRFDMGVASRGITSHRKFLGPVIVTAKRFLLSLLSGPLEKLFSEQRHFNSTLLELTLSTLSHKPLLPSKPEEKVNKAL